MNKMSKREKALLVTIALGILMAVAIIHPVYAWLTSQDFSEAPELIQAATVKGEFTVEFNITDRTVQFTAPQFIVNPNMAAANNLKYLKFSDTIGDAIITVINNSNIDCAYRLTIYTNSTCTTAYNVIYGKVSAKTGAVPGKAKNLGINIPVHLVVTTPTVTSITSSIVTDNNGTIISTANYRVVRQGDAYVYIKVELCQYTYTAINDVFGLSDADMLYWFGEIPND